VSKAAIQGEKYLRNRKEREANRSNSSPTVPSSGQPIEVTTKKNISGS
jgi:hypothetical protein